MIHGGSILSVRMVSSNYLSYFLLVRDTKFRWSQSVEQYSTAWYIFWWEGKNGGILSYFKWQTMSAFPPMGNSPPVMPYWHSSIITPSNLFLATSIVMAWQKKNFCLKIIYTTFSKTNNQIISMFNDGKRSARWCF